MTEPERDDRAVDAGFEELHGSGVAKDVRRYVLAGEGRARPRRLQRVLRHEPLDGDVP